ncbi:VOC family protein [Actinokineospora sp. PR83]|uniref:VOC family protein n=1 Tax=Actinokineospora sp. PR83 TaxID=2884908 RepID=UPI001F1A4B27|nr:VOC family protein [Actinokineospora sp. PR83]MCG8918293.1 VOC family protein [Actinokineospora sp. PR83]
MATAKHTACFRRLTRPLDRVNVGDQEVVIMSMDAISALEEIPDGMPGKPCWVELATPDPRTASEFYAGLFGWAFRVGEDGYVMAYVDDVPVAGLHVPLGEQPTRWTLYLSVGDTANTAERVVQLGGAVLSEPTEVPGQGGLLVAADPSGAAIGFWRQDRDRRLGTGFPGAFTWAELNTWDGAAADAFYSALFDYEVVQMGDGQAFDYTSWVVRGEEVLGRLRMGSEFPPEQEPHWMVFFEVDPLSGTDRVASRAQQLGGRVVVPPFDSPFGRAAVLADNTGAEFTVLDRTDALPVVVEDEIGAPVDYDD